MPELPEVEVTRMSVIEHVRGARICGVRVGKPLRWPLGCEAAEVLGHVVMDVTRRGKYLWFALGRTEDGHGAATPGLLWHLGMSGSLLWLDHATTPADAMVPGPHDHFDLLTDRGVLRLHDPRRFGAVVWGPACDQAMPGRLLRGLGVEPLSDAFTAQVLHEGLKGRRMAIKPALLAGDVVVGVGNIYASEALFRAGIHPKTPAARVSLKRCERLVEAIRAVLHAAVMAGGSSLKDFRNAAGDSGAFQDQAAVYGREGQPCHSCETPIRRVVQGQRATYFCPSCQH